MEQNVAALAVQRNSSLSLGCYRLETDVLGRGRDGCPPADAGLASASAIPFRTTGLRFGNSATSKEGSSAFLYLSAARGTKALHLVMFA
jgi:hypothetical protein